MSAAAALAAAAAAATTGATAGFLLAWRTTVIPGLADLPAGPDDQGAAVRAFGAMDRRIGHPAFAAAFVGAIPATGAAAVLHLGHDDPRVQALAVAPAVLYAVALGITRVVHLPINARVRELTATGAAPAPAAITAARDAVVGRWHRWNGVRTALAAGACAASLAVLRLGA